MSSVNVGKRKEKDWAFEKLPFRPKSILVVSPTLRTLRYLVISAKFIDFDVMWESKTLFRFENTRTVV